MTSPAEVNETSFENEVLRSSQPVIVSFWAAGCEVSRRLAILLNEIAAEHAGRLKIVTVEVNINPNLAAYYHVQSVPTLLYFYNGLIHDQTLGLVEKSAILSKMETALGVLTVR